MLLLWSIAGIFLNMLSILYITYNAASGVISILLMSSNIIIYAGIFCCFLIIKKRCFKMNEKLKMDETLGVLNKKYFSEEVKRVTKNVDNCCMLVFDVDNFKRINDTKGHKYGDEILKRVATILKNEMRYNDVLGRIGGDEFCALTLGKTGSAIFLAERIRKKIKEYCKKDGITISIGISELNPEKDIEKFFVDADGALYNSKHLGRNKTSYCKEAKFIIVKKV